MAFLVELKMAIFAGLKMAIAMEMINLAFLRLLQEARIQDLT